MSGGELGEYLRAPSFIRGHATKSRYPETTVDHWIQVGSDDLEQRLHDGVATPGHEILAVCTESQMVGENGREIDGQCSTMQYLYILWPPPRERLSGRAALIGLAERLRAEGVRRIQAFMVPGQRHIIEVCMSVGFKVTERVVRISSPSSPAAMARTASLVLESHPVAAKTCDEYVRTVDSLKPSSEAICRLDMPAMRSEKISSWLIH